VGNTDAFGVVLTPCNQRAVNLLSCTYSENSAVYTSGCRIKIVKQKELINNGNSRRNLTFLSFGSGSPKLGSRSQSRAEQYRPGWSTRFYGRCGDASRVARSGPLDQTRFRGDAVTPRVLPATVRAGR
jgi:hypothetical protein